MTELLSLLLLAFAVSLDSFGVGLTYGLRKMRLPLLSLLFIASCSAISILLAMGIGGMIQQFISPSLAESIGGIILICIGLWAIYQLYRPAKTERKSKKERETIVNLELKKLGIVIKVLRKPMFADLDNSGAITGKEAFLLGLALSLDAFGAGIGAALIGFSPWVMAISTGIMCGIFVTLGMKSGWFFSDAKWVKRFSFVPGLLLILIGVWQL
ncbi:sporulation membrane protein YtaF [Evansella sp. AB-P1]|uniref:sporulation membrane protein YtaF n=1 Tax=Evansella sp. AB-P1 TaxID=3037653 RepID=UPI00241C6900|nr:sporulation membrane protein YtaF [Evansella sp. AB-P1]MDG5786968.1 sporulation membrane protein YtaF [Evansella sp. AB-P1]